MKTAIYNLLSGDATLMGTLTGGLYGSAVEISRQATPGAFDGNGELLPCALLKLETASPWGPHDDSGRLYVVVYFYERSGYSNIEAARKRVYELLHRVKVTPVADGGNYDIRHGNDLIDIEDQALHVPMALSRYVATVQR
jgi:hypothetical protein